MSDGFNVSVDGSDLTYGERLTHYQKQFGVWELPIDQREPTFRLAHDLVTEEMLTEIHAMLRILIKDRRQG